MLSDVEAQLVELRGMNSELMRRNSELVGSIADLARSAAESTRRTLAAEATARVRATAPSRDPAPPSAHAVLGAPRFGAERLRAVAHQPTRAEIERRFRRVPEPPPKPVDAGAIGTGAATPASPPAGEQA